MATNIVKLKVDGAQVYPQTHASAVVGLETIQGPKGDKGDTGPQGPAGTNATTTSTATTTANGLMSSTDKSKLDSIPRLSVEVVGSV